jgi:hypothetical protein
MKSIGIRAAALLGLAALVVAAGVVQPVPAQEPPPSSPTFRPYRHPVTIWVPPYAVAKSKAQLTASFDNTGAKDAITYLALQFWIPTKEGGVERVKFDEVTDAAIQELRDWGHANGIRVLLCVYNHNGPNKWDWPLAKAAFADHPKEFVKSLVSEMERLGLDGIDIDLEGPGSFDADKEAFVSFMTDLSRELRFRSKHLTVDSFAYVWNAPNQNWWPALLPLVDALTSMGYDETGSTAPEWRSYTAQKSAAGSSAAKLQIGMPSGKDQWRGNTAIEQLQWVRKDNGTGVAIWDAQLRSPAWKTPEVWQTLRGIRDGKP